TATAIHMTLPTRSDALALVHEYTTSDSLRKHMLAVEAAMRAYARHFGEDEERWALAGLLHDFDYERFPNAAQSATEEHPSEGVRILRERVGAGGEGHDDGVAGGRPRAVDDEARGLGSGSFGAGASGGRRTARGRPSVAGRRIR
ncbi:MAG TPA: HD domain-containing protein, partial [Gemmatimonadaceae bacterium]|nr:HD domain-containing protein [Gemmatimonadaceae bacterium]